MLLGVLLRGDAEAALSRSALFPSPNAILRLALGDTLAAGELGLGFAARGESGSPGGA